MTQPLHTLLFIDLAAHIAVAHARENGRADTAAEKVADRVVEIASPSRAEEIKPLVDAVVFRGDDPVRAVALGLRLVRTVSLGPSEPALSIGVHAGPVSGGQGDDWSSSAVRAAALAARRAVAGEVLLTAAARTVAGIMRGVELQPLGAHRARAGDPAHHYSVRSSSDSIPLRSIDPVCGMPVHAERPGGRLIHRDTIYSFCSSRCLGTFAAAPEDHTPDSLEEARELSPGRA